ncbi:helix-turn-helix domain-containing protein [Amycolatopsis endophytica]|uniref:Transcriptional regulator with XRE-family HTH domain n=1 Tax=Amycolatopsis endophytica TaxID=860233 RepID=A0A853B6V1_9PSEU|nr:hypothetical protein [Amycolatopsis endophytica]NYI90993.1 transcriptional regulator with XRE-family HTH domain [Amycolatopsis endophytica]
MDPDRGVREGGPLAAKITHLIATLYPDGRPGYARLAAQIRERTGATLSSTYLWELASGRKRNLTQETLGTLAAFFGVPADYFLDDAMTSRVDAQLELAKALRNQKVRSIALRADGLSDATLDALLAMVTEARESERLAPPDDEPGAEGRCGKR